MSGVQVSGSDDNNEEVQVEENTQQEPVQEQPVEEPKQRKTRGPNKPKAPVPAIGRIVYYVTTSGTVRPAIITAVNEGDMDLTVFNSKGAVSVTEVVFDTELPGETPGTVFWPEHN